MEEFLVPIGIFVIGVITGFMDSTVGSGGLVSIPMLIFAGLPPHVAIATDRFGTVGQGIGAFVSFWKARKIVWEFVLLFSLLAFVGGFVGANVLLFIADYPLEKIIGAILLLTIPLLFFKPHLGIKRVAVGVVRKIIGSIIYVLVMVYNGIFGTGSGPLATYNLLEFFGLTMLQAAATNVIPWFVLSATTLVIFLQNGIVDFGNGIALLLGMIVGGYIGARFLIRIGDVWVKRVFIVVVIFFGIRLLF